MPDIFSNWLLLITIFGIALMSPGPDFVMAVRNSVMYTRRAGIFTALGFAAGVAVHMTYTVAGLAAVIAQSVLLFSILKYIGAGYLFYVGFRALQSKGFAQDPHIADGTTPPSMSNWQALRSGFITNLFNPKATMFCLALFSQIIHPDYSLAVQAMFGATCVVMTALWFSLVATVLTTPAIKARFLRAAKWIDRTCGAFFIALGVKLALSKAA